MHTPTSNLRGSPTSRTPMAESTRRIVEQGCANRVELSPAQPDYEASPLTSNTRVEAWKRIEAPNGITVTVTRPHKTADGTGWNYRVDVSDGKYAGLGYGDTEKDAFTEALISFDESMRCGNVWSHGAFRDTYEAGKGEITWISCTRF